MADWMHLLKSNRWVALGSIESDGAPLVSSVACALCANLSSPGLVMHLSELAAHTKNLLERPHCSILVAETDLGKGDPQELQRLSLIGTVEVIERDHEDYPDLAKVYVDQFPEAEMRFSFGDFHLFRFIPKRGNYIAGFGKATRLKSESINEAFAS